MTRLTHRRSQAHSGFLQLPSATLVCSWPDPARSSIVFRSPRRSSCSRDPGFREAQVVVDEPLGWVRAHPLTLQYAILNLLVNAVTYVSAGTRPAIHISNEARGPFVRLSIQDNGRGIDPSALPHIFDLFVQEDSRVTGMGVGLHVVRQIVERHGGMVEGRSDGKGLGSEFVVQLPLAT